VYYKYDIRHLFLDILRFDKYRGLPAKAITFRNTGVASGGGASFDLSPVPDCAEVLGRPEVRLLFRTLDPGEQKTEAGVREGVEAEKKEFVLHIYDLSAYKTKDTLLFLAFLKFLIKVRFNYTLTRDLKTLCYR
jgi:hypothetical protein